MKKLTVIVPCYNSETYIDKCYYSLMNQTFKDFNVIFIDDHSTDKTLKKLESYSIKNESVSIIANKTNSGAGVSRNKALEHVKTEYVTFLDADDYYDDNYLAAMMEKIEKDEADISICDIYLKYEVSTDDHINELVPCCDDELTKKNYIVNGLAASPCNKIFKYSLFECNKFGEGIVNEDIPVIITCLIRANKISYVGNVHYNYIQHNKSVQNSSLSLKKLDIFKSIEMLIRRNKGIKKEDYYDGIIFNQIILLLFYVVPKENDKKVRLEFLKEYALLAKKYDLNKNSYLDKFYLSQSKMHKTYFKIMINLISLGLYRMVNTMITMYKSYKDNYTKRVLKDEYTIDDLVEEAKKDRPIKELSVIIPNYNYAKFIYQRIYSILNQDYKINELIILDDKSTDNSVEVINEIADKLKKYINVKVIINKKNSGSPFAQWKKGINEATSKYVWIAEADDYCDHDFLKSIFNEIEKDDKIVIAYANTAFINTNGYVIQRSVVSDIDLQNTGHWNKTYINDGKDEINNYAYLNCTIANVSSVIMKRENTLKVFDEVGTFKQAGDWLFYLDIMEQGKVAYINKAINYYRIHGSNATTLNKKQLQFDEIKKIHKIVDQKYKLNDSQKKLIQDRYNFLKMKWKVK